MGYIVGLIAFVMLYDSLLNMEKEGRLIYTVVYILGFVVLLSMSIAMILSTEWVV
jgi:hypothetical protein